MQATAFVVGPQDGPGAAVRDLAIEFGIATVLPFVDAAQAERQATTALAIFLFAAVDDPGRLRPAADAIRFCAVPRLRFSPLIYFSESPSREAIRQCAAMGFDDVVTLPFTAERVAERIGRQLDTPRVYFETQDYFGPDRRRPPGGTARSGRGTGGHHRRIEIVRSAEAGVVVLRDEVLAV